MEELETKHGKKPNGSNVILYIKKITKDIVSRFQTRTHTYVPISQLATIILF